MKLGIGWQIGVPSGWGTYGLNLALHLARRGVEPVPLLTAPNLAETLDPMTRRILAPALAEAAPLSARLAGQQALALPHPLLCGLGDGLFPSTSLDRVTGHPEVGVAFIESALIPPGNRDHARRFARIISGSSWNQMVLDAHGLETARLCFQGIDPSRFHPAPKAGLLPRGRFAIFSGGKLEFRKGQDIVAAAFRAFHARHPEALLVTAWHNLWPQSLATLADSPHRPPLPEMDSRGRLGVTAWLTAQGIPAEAVLDLGAFGNAEAPRLLRECDLAVFPNRCEGGTNLVAMEAMACGLPTILSANTGHLDLIAGRQTQNTPVCWGLDDQDPVPEPSGTAKGARLGWGETRVEALVEAMEEAWRDREEAARRGAAAARFLAAWSWEAQVGQFVDLLTEAGVLA